jgi:hypothetical protein
MDAMGEAGGSRIVSLEAGQTGGHAKWRVNTGLREARTLRVRPMEPTSAMATCLFCGAGASPALNLPRFGGASCEECARRVGHLVVASPTLLTDIWPLLAEEEDDDEPEPMVQRSDGSSVQLRQLTAELKRELSVEDRMKLAELYGDIGLVREQLEECGRVLVAAPVAALAQRALDVLFSAELCSPLGLDPLRGHLFPA